MQSPASCRSQVSRFSLFSSLANGRFFRISSEIGTGGATLCVMQLSVHLPTFSCSASVSRRDAKRQSAFGGARFGQLNSGCCVVRDRNFFLLFGKYIRFEVSEKSIFDFFILPWLLKTVAIGDNDKV